MSARSSFARRGRPGVRRELDPAFDVSGDFRELLRDHHRNRLLLEVSYWFNP